MKEIGGYFELEIPSGGGEYHSGAIALNTGRNALEYILKGKGYKKVYLPVYYCSVMLEPLIKLGIEYTFYKIDYNFEFEDICLLEDEGIVYINYFGLKDAYIRTLAGKYTNLIVDNAQAFFSEPLPGVDTYYSCRKYFGVPDGGYLYTNTALPALPTDSSEDRYKHLIGRIDNSASAYYSQYAESEESLCSQDIRYMSPSTRMLLSSVDYERAAARRRNNFAVLHTHLAGGNRLQLPAEGVFLCYPFLFSGALKHRLIQHKVYIATYWPNVQKGAAPGSVERDLADNLICLPLDQRYDTNDMENILKLIKE